MFSLRSFYRRKKVNSLFGKCNKLCTDMIHYSCTLGTGIYLARNVSLRDHVVIGDYSYCSAGAILFPGTEVGKFCSIGYNVQISVPEHPTGFLSTSPKIYRNEKMRVLCQWPDNDIKKPSKIGNDVWIGSNAVILQGVKIGNGAIIAAGAVVTKDVPPFAVVGGVPAKKIRMRFDDETIKRIEESCWWNWDIDKISSFANELFGEK